MVFPSHDIPLYVLSHRIDESLGTNRLLKDGVAKPIFDLDGFIRSIGGCDKQKLEDNEALMFAASMPTVAEFVNKFGDTIYELELDGSIVIKNGKVMPN